MRHAWILLAALAIGLPTVVAAQSDWFPLVEGYVWTHSSSLGGTIETVVGGPVVVQGVPTQVLESLRTIPFQDHWMNYWTVDEGGDVYLHGFRNLSGDVGVGYHPPILWLAADPGPSMSWETSTMPFDLDTGEVMDPLVVQFQLVEDVEVAVPAGSFLCRQLVRTVGDPIAKSGARFDLLGAMEADGLVLARGSESTLYYAEGIGRLKEISCCPAETEELVMLVSVANERLSFGGLKASYDGSARLP